MADKIDDEIAKIIHKYVLVNAIEHEGIAKSGSVLGLLLSEHIELRSRVSEIKTIIEKETEKVNKITLEEQKEELSKLGGFEKKVKEQREGLIELPEAKIGRVVLRFAPNPDGAIHIGNARAAVLNYEYAKKYKGKFILRFDDTDPKIKIPEKHFYDFIRADLKWLGIKWSKEIIASKRLKIYYKYAKKIIKLGKAYVCTCGEEWKNLRNKSQPCPCRDSKISDNLEKWKQMLKHSYKEGQAVLRIKTSLVDPNPAVRDWAAFRIVDNPKHPLVKAHLWPLYNFASAIDDHEFGITHILRGQEHSTNETKQRYLYEHFGWKYPKTIVLGRFSMSGLVLSKSKIREGIKNHEYEGWNDVRLGTLMSLKRRGFQAEAIKKLIIDIGVKPSDVKIAIENLSGYNKKIIDNIADRYYFVSNPIEIKVKNNTIKKAELPVHPEKKKKRVIKIGKIFFVDGDDYKKYHGTDVRLKGLFNIKLEKETTMTDFEIRDNPKIQWVPEQHIDVEVIKPEGIVKGYGEINLLKTKPYQVVQFERFGFVRIEKVDKKKIVAVFAHQ